MTHQVATAANDDTGQEWIEATQHVLDAAGADIKWIAKPVGRTADLGGTATTRDITETICSACERIPA